MRDSEFRIHPAGHFWPPEVQAAQVAHDRASHHDVVEMGDHKIRVMNVDVQPQTSEEESGEPTDEKQADEAERVDHWRFPRYRGSVKCGGPIGKP